MRVFVDLCTFLTPQLLTRWYQLNVQVFCQWNSARPVLVQCVALAFLFMHWYYCIPCYQPCKVLYLLNGTEILPGVTGKKYLLNGTEILPGVTYRKKKTSENTWFVVNCWIFWTAMPKRGIHICKAHNWLYDIFPLQIWHYSILVLQRAPFLCKWSKRGSHLLHWGYLGKHTWDKVSNLHVLFEL